MAPATVSFPVPTRIQDRSPMVEAREAVSKNDLSRPINGYEITRNCPCLLPPTPPQRYIAVVTRSKLLLHPSSPNKALLPAAFQNAATPLPPLCPGTALIPTFPSMGTFSPLLILRRSLVVFTFSSSIALTTSSSNVNEKKKNLRGMSGKKESQESNRNSSVDIFLILDDTRIQ